MMSQIQINHVAEQVVFIFMQITGERSRTCQSCWCYELLIWTPILLLPLSLISLLSMLKAFTKLYVPSMVCHLHKIYLYFINFGFLDVCAFKFSHNLDTQGKQQTQQTSLQNIAKEVRHSGGLGTRLDCLVYHFSDLEKTDQLANF